MLDFYKLWAKTAFSGSWGQIEFWTGLAGAVALVIGHFYPHDVPFIDSLGFYVLAWACIIIVGLRILMTPYWIYQESQNKINAQEASLEGFRKAWDKTGKYEITVNEAVKIIADFLEKTEPGLSENDRLFRAFAKIREIGFSGKIPITGHEFDEEEIRYEEFKEDIPAHFWQKNRLNLNAMPNQINDQPQTMVDERWEIETQVQRVFGRLRINKEALLAMFQE